MVGSEYYDGVVEGVVYDDDVLEPLEDVRVVYNNLVACTTGKDGYYSLVFEKMLKGEQKEYDVKFSKSGYEDVIKTLTVIGGQFKAKDVLMWRIEER